jgi:MoaA/NifB/PqqE/SkfB family radical SAM enzyme
MNVFTALRRLNPQHPLRVAARYARRRTGLHPKLGAAPIAIRGETHDQRIARLARTFAPRHLLAEMTSRCNLRCRYCQKASDEWNARPGRDEDMSADAEERVFAALERLPFRTVQLSGIGEFTFRKDWTTTLERFIQHGVTVTLISNFAKKFTDAELRALLKVQHLMVSIDTTDAQLLRSVRKAVSVATIDNNLVRLRALAKEIRAPMPYVKLNAVLYVENALGIEDLAKFAITHRVNEMQYERMLAPGSYPTDLALLPQDRAIEALAQCDAASSLLAANNIAASFHGDLKQLLAERAATVEKALEYRH